MYIIHVYICIIDALPRLEVETRLAARLVVCPNN